jgi:hypothetical protein
MLMRLKYIGPILQGKIRLSSMVGREKKAKAKFGVRIT